MSKKSIYQTQMEKLGLTDSQYSQLTGIPLKLLRKVLRNEKVSDNMSLEDFFRRDMVNKHQEIEKDEKNTQLKSVEIKMKDRELLDWYKNKYDKKDLFLATKCVSIYEFERKYDIKVKDKTASRWFYACIAGKSGYDRVSQETIIEFAKQLKDIIDGNAEKYEFKDPRTDLTRAKNLGVRRDLENSKLLKWHYKFDYNNFLEENKISIADFCEVIGIARKTYDALARKKSYIPSEALLQRIKDFVKNPIIEKIEVLDLEDTIETKPIEPLESFQIGNITVAPMDENEIINGLKELIKERLTEQEKALIRLFGGNI